jgi:hypothetical protein
VDNETGRENGRGNDTGRNMESVQKEIKEMKKCMFCPAIFEVSLCNKAHC